MRDYGDIGYSTPTEVHLARAYLALGDMQNVKTALRRWFQNATVIGSPEVLLPGLCVLGQLFVAEGDREKAKALITAMNGYSFDKDIQPLVIDLAQKLGLSLDNPLQPKPLSVLIEIAGVLLED